MKRLTLVGLKPCPYCRRAVAYVMTEDGEHTLGIALDATRARELSRKDPVSEKFLTDLLVELLAPSPYVPRKIVLDWAEEGFLTARVDLTKEIFSCSLQEAVALAAVAGIPLYATEKAFQKASLFHPPDKEGVPADTIQPKPKPTLH